MWVFQWILGGLVIVSMVLVVSSIVRDMLRGPDRPPEQQDAPKDRRGDRLYDPRNAQPIPLAATACVHSWEILKDEVLDVGHQKKMVVVAKCGGCGLLHETVETTDPPPAAVKVDPPRSECRHDWAVDKAVELDSAYEQMRESLKLLTSAKAPGQQGTQTRDRWEQAMEKAKATLLPDPNKASPWMYRKEYVQVRTCRRCGEVKVVQAANIQELAEGKREA